MHVCGPWRHSALNPATAGCCCPHLRAIQNIVDHLHVRAIVSNSISNVSTQGDLVEAEEVERLAFVVQLVARAVDEGLWNRKQFSSASKLISSRTAVRQR